MKAAISIRVSTTKEEQESSLVHQKQFFENYVQEKGWDIAGFYEETESGTKSNRKEMNRLISDAKAKKFDVILSKELSRLARNQRLAHELKDVIEKYGIHLITMDGAIDTTTGNTNMFGLYAWIYEQEAQRTSERIKTVIKTKAKRGLFKGSNPPYGYEVNEGKLFIRNDHIPDVVRKIFQRYLEGRGFDAIAKELFEDDVPTPSMVAKKKNATIYWHGSSVRKILENPHYIGSLVQGRQSTISVTNKSRKEKPKDEYIIVKDTHEAIISKDVFETVQQMIAFERDKKAQSNPNKNSRSHQNVHLFTGVIQCADCGAGFHYKRNGNCYICGRSDKLGDKACSKHRVREDALKRLIRSDLQKLAATMKDDSVLDFTKGKLKNDKIRVEKDLHRCEKQMESIKSLKKKALTKFLDDLISKEDYDDFISSKDAELKKLLLRQEELKTVMSMTVDTADLVKVQQVIDDALAFNDITREVISRFIERIEVGEDGKVRLYYRFAGSTSILKALL